MTKQNKEVVLVARRHARGEGGGLSWDGTRLYDQPASPSNPARGMAREYGGINWLGQSPRLT